MSLFFCTHCGGYLAYAIPGGDDRPRYVCKDCGLIHYENPKMVVGCIPEWEDKILLVRRAIEPCYGKWTLPAGYLENGESVADGAQRETFEESNVRTRDLELFAIFNILLVNQVYLIFRARMVDTRFSPTPESLEVKLFTESEIPWSELAFPVNVETLRHYYADIEKGAFSFHMGDL